MTKRKKYLDATSPIYARSDATSSYINNANRHMITNMPIRRGTKYQYEDVGRQQIAEIKEADRQRVASRGKGLTKLEKQRTKKQIKKINNYTKFATNITGLGEKPTVRVNQAQLYDKDKVDKAKLQSNYLNNAFLATGQDWGNRLNPYTQTDLIDAAYNSKNMADLSSFVIGTGAGNPITTGIGVLGGYAGSELLPKVWNNKYASLVGGVVGGVLGGGMSALTKQGYKYYNIRALNKAINNISLDKSLDNIPPKRIYKYPTNRTYDYDFQKFTTLPKRINKETAKNFTDIQWDKLYNKALKQGDVKGLKRLRNLHFVAKAGNKGIYNKYGMPLEQYHTVADKYNPNFNIFDTNIEGTHTSIFTTPNKRMSSSYARGIISDNTSYLNRVLRKPYKDFIDKTKLGIDNYKDNLQQLESAGYFDKVSDFIFGAPPIPVRSYRAQINRRINHLENILKQGFEGYKTSRLSTFKGNRMKSLFGIMENPSYWEGEGHFWNEIPFKGNSSYPISTRMIDKAIQNSPFDGAVIRSIKDYGGTPQFGYKPKYIKDLTPHDVYEYKNSSQLKYSDAITYDDNGHVIPLSKRDNFNINDLRYGTVPILLGGKVLYNINKKDKRKTN